MDESLKVICRHDEAIDVEAMSDEDRARYRETRDPSHLRFLPGEKPAIFWVRRLRTSEMRDVTAQPIDPHTPGEMPLRWEAAFRRGLVRGDDIRFTDQDERGAYKRPTDKPLNDGQLDRFAPADVLEVGSFIYNWSLLGKGRPAAWPLPATSQSALEALAVLRAAQKRASAARSAQSSEPAAEAAASHPASSPDGGKPGDATATG